MPYFLSCHLPACVCRCSVSSVPHDKLQFARAQILNPFAVAMANLSTELRVPYATPGETYAASIVLPGLGIVFVLLRLYTRFLQKNKFGVDDWLLLPALVSTFCPA